MRRTRSKRNWAPGWAKVEAEGVCRAARPGLLLCEGPLDPAHIVPRGQIPVAAGDDPRATIPLCRRHHMQAHHGELETLGLLTLEEQSFVVGLVGIERARRYTTGRAA